MEMMLSPFDILRDKIAAFMAANMKLPTEIHVSRSVRTEMEPYSLRSLEPKFDFTGNGAGGECWYEYDGMRVRVMDDAQDNFMEVS